MLRTINDAAAEYGVAKIRLDGLIRSKKLKLHIVRRHSQQAADTGSCESSDDETGHLLMLDTDDIERYFSQHPEELSLWRQKFNDPEKYNV